MAAAPALALAVLVLAAAHASAHAVLLESDPPGGARLAQAPERVQVTLTEPVDPQGSTLMVYDADGRQVDLRDLEVQKGSRPVLTVSLPEDLPDGAYAARWRALSTVDGHSTFGTVGFAVGGFQPPGTSESGIGTWDAASTTGRSLAFVGTAVALASLAGLLMASVRAPGILLAGAATHAAGTVLILWDAARDAGLALSAFAATDVGGILVPRTVAALSAALLATLWWVRPVRAAPWIIALFLGWTAFQSARLGHASTGGPVIVALDALHYVAAAAWVAGVLALWLVLRRPATHRQDDASLVRLGTRFSTWATLLVVVTVSTGVVLMAEILGARALQAAWIDTSWGLLLVTKWALLAGMLAMALRNRSIVRRGEAPSPRFVRSVAWEAVLGALVLVAAGALTAVGAPPPPGPLTEGAVPVQGDEVFGTMAIRPAPETGATSLVVFFLQTEEGPVETDDCGREDCIWLEVGPYGAGSRTSLEPEGGGVWSTEVLWTEPGTTDLTLEVQTGTIYLDVITATTDVAKAS